MIQTLREAVSTTLGDEEMFGPEGACPALSEPGVLDRVLVVTGENAGGKSLFCRYLDQNAGIEVMRVGMGIRTRSGIQRAMMFGDEETESTGAVSGNVVATAIRTARSRAGPHWLILDEPDVGLGEGYQAAAGEFLAEFARDLPSTTVGFVVVSHSRALVAPLVAAGACSVRIGDDRRAVARWLAEGDLPRTVDEFEAFGDKSRRRWKAVEAIQNARRAAKRASPRE